MTDGQQNLVVAGAVAVAFVVTAVLLKVMNWVLDRVLAPLLGLWGDDQVPARYEIVPPGNAKRLLGIANHDWNLGFLIMLAPWAWHLGFEVWRNGVAFNLGPIAFGVGRLRVSAR